MPVGKAGVLPKKQSQNTVDTEYMGIISQILQVG